MSWKEASAASKVLIVFTVMFLVSLGMCGISASTGLGGMETGVMELLGMFVSVIGIVITLIVAFIHGVFTRRGDHPQTLFSNRDDEE